MNEENPLVKQYDLTQFGRAIYTSNPTWIQGLMGASRETLTELFTTDRGFDYKYIGATEILEMDEPPIEWDFVVDNFIPANIEDRVPAWVKMMREELQLKLRQRRVQAARQGDVDIDQLTPRQAEHLFADVVREIDADELLGQVAGLLPLGVMGAITTTLQYQGADDQTKREAYRSVVNQALLRRYLGPIAVHRHVGGFDEDTFKRVVDIIPERIFADATGATAEIIRNFFRNEALVVFAGRSTEEGFARLADLVEAEANPVKQGFLEQIYEYMEEVDRMQVSPRFVSELVSRDEEGNVVAVHQFPHIRQKEFVHRLINGVSNERPELSQLVKVGTGGGKTALSLLSVEQLGKKRAVVFCPAIARNTWRDEVRKLYREEERPDVLVVESARDLEDLRMETAQYVVISTALLARADQNEELYNRLAFVLTQKRQTDAVIFDESHNLRNPRAHSSRVAMDLMQAISANYAEVHGEHNSLLRLALTATPLVNGLEDYDVTMGMLFPSSFGLPGRNGGENGLPTFSQRCLRNPRIAYSLLSTGRMTAFGQRDLFGESAPQMIEQELTTPLRPMQRVLANWVEQLPMSSLAGITSLLATNLNPELIRSRIERSSKWRQRLPQEARELLQLRMRLAKNSENGERQEIMARIEGHSMYQRLQRRAWDAYEVWSSVMAERPSGEIQSFNEDWVATYDPQFALECFWVFGGVDNFIRRQSGDVWQALKRRDFAPVQEISATFEVLKQYLRERMVLTEQGYDLNENIFIVSPHWRELVTRWYEDMGQDAEMMDTFSLYERIRGEWLAELPEHLLAAVDGGHSFKHRTEMAELFGNRSLRVVVGSERAIGESMNWADRQRGLATHVAKTTVIYLGYPWGDAVIEQTGGRFNRPGAPSAYRIMLEMEETIDQGMRLNVLKKRLLKEIVDFGGQLTAEQQEFLRRATTARRVVMGHEATGLTYVTRTLHGLKGRGEAAIMEYMQSPYMGRDHYWGLAVNFWDNGRDQLRQVGRNAKVVVGIAQRLGARMPVDVGCGTALFGRNYPIGTVLSVDLSAEMLRLVAEHYPHVGEVRRGLASDLSAVVQSNSRDFANYAYMLDLTRLYNDDGSSPEDVTEIERVKVLSEMHRILEQGGVAVITLAQSSLDRTTFRNFCNALERHFGFTVMPELSGETYATDLRLRIGWAITVRKTGFVGLDGLNWHDLFLLSDAAETISYPKEENEEEVPQTVFVHVEQPLAEAREFEILNPLTTDSVQLEVAGAQTAPVYPPRYDQLPRIETNGVVHEEVAEEAVEEEVDEVTRYKQTHFDDGSYWRVWNRAVRRLTDEFGDRLVDYGQAERVLHSVLMLEENRGMQQPLNWNQGRFADWAVRQVQRWLDEQENM